MIYFFRNDKIAYNKLFLLTNSTTVHVPFVMGILNAIGKKAIECIFLLGRKLPIHNYQASISGNVLYLCREGASNLYLHKIASGNQDLKKKNQFNNWTWR